MSPEQVRECMSEYDVDNGKLGTTLALLPQLQYCSTTTYLAYCLAVSLSHTHYGGADFYLCRRRDRAVGVYFIPAPPSQGGGEKAQGTLPTYTVCNPVLCLGCCPNLPANTAVPLPLFSLLLSTTITTITLPISLQELTEFPIMCIGAETEVRRYVPPRTGTLTLVIADGFTTKVSTASVRVQVFVCVYIYFIFTYTVYIACMHTIIISLFLSVLI